MYSTCNGILLSHEKGDILIFITDGIGGHYVKENQSGVARLLSYVESKK